VPNEPLDPKNLPNTEAERAKLAIELRDAALEAFRANQPLVASLKISDALLLGPNERATLDAFDEIVFATQDPLSLFPVATGAIHVATAAARARVLMIQRRLPDALDLLGRVLEVAPELEYMDWARRWLQPHVLPELGFDRIMGSVVKPLLVMAVDVPVPPDPSDPRLPNLRSGGEILAALQPAFPDEKFVWMGSAIVRRRLGDTAATLAAAEEGVRRFPQDWALRTAWLNALRDAKRPDEALQQARVAMQIDPADFSPLHDAAHAYLDAGRPADAANLFQELLQRAANYPGADACLHYARFKAGGDPADRAALLTLRDRRPFNGAVRSMADELDPPVPYFTVLPGPADATAHFARDVVSDFAELLRCCGRGASIELAIQSRFPESPSAAIAFDFAMRSMGAGSARLGVEIDSFQQPDPRVDKAQVAFPIFQPRGNMPGPIATSADPNLANMVGGVAYQPFRKDVWDPQAQQLAAHVGPGAAQALLAVLLNPPPPPTDFDGVTWFYRCQIATAIVLSHLGPWPTGPGRAALYSMICGPSDWVTIAGIVGLAWRAGDSPTVRSEVEGSFSWLRTQIPKDGFTPWEGALAYAWQSMGQHEEGLRQALASWIDEYERTLPSKNAVRTMRRHGGMTLEDYAKFSVKRDRLVAGLGYPGPGALIGGFTPPPALVQLCQPYGLDPQIPFVMEWQEALNANPRLNERFIEARRTFELSEMGVSSQEKGALDNILDGNMDMHLRMAQAQQAQAQVAAGDGGDPDPVVFPGQRVAKLSDYVGILKGMQGGNMMGALANYGLDMMSYGSVAQAWGAKMAADPMLTEKFNKMMQAR
jgi:tetratricopeptide (TPR) repeat protein